MQRTHRSQPLGSPQKSHFLILGSSLIGSYVGTTLYSSIELGPIRRSYGPADLIDHPLGAVMRIVMAWFVFWQKNATSTSGLHLSFQILPHEVGRGFKTITKCLYCAPIGLSWRRLAPYPLVH